jgi:hypothetical protein
VSDTSVRFTFDLDGVDPDCDSIGPDEDEPNSCGISFQEGTACSGSDNWRDPHYYNDDVTGSDPWTYGATYSDGQGSELVTYGINADETIGHVFLVRDRAGNRISCAVVDSVDIVPAFTFTEDVTFAWREAGAVSLYYDLGDADEDCEDLGPDAEQARSCGIQIRGGACSDVGETFYNTATLDEDPWDGVSYTDHKGSIAVSYGIGSRSTVGKVLVVYNRAGDQISCTEIPTLTRCASNPYFQGYQVAAGENLALCGSNRSVTCEPFYTGTPENITCESNGEWEMPSGCSPDDCTANVPTGSGYGTECDGLVTDDKCEQFCTAGYYSAPADQAGRYSCTDGEFTGVLLKCSANDCNDEVPVGAGFGTGCDGLVTDDSCTQKCTAGYSDNNGGEGQTYTCDAGDFDGDLLECTPNPCPGFPTGAGYGTECASLVTDASCTQTCTTGYSPTSGDGSFTCPAGTLTGASDPITPLVCDPDDCTAGVPTGAGFGTECAGLVTDASCTQFCLAGFSDNNGGSGQTYTCNAGNFDGTLLTCTPAAALQVNDEVFTVEVTLIFAGLTVADINDETTMEDVIATSLPPAAGEILEVFDSEDGLVVVTEFTFDNEAEASFFSEEAPTYSVTYLGHNASVTAEEPVLELPVINSATLMSMTVTTFVVLSLPF